MLNAVNLQGRFTKDPEQKTTAGGTVICSFQLASDRSMAKGKEKQTDFIPCVSFGKTAEFISKYFSKGEMAIISGQLQSRNYEAQDGSKRTAYEVYVRECHFCGGRASGGTQEAQKASTAPASLQDDYADINWDEIPDLPDAF